MNPPTRSRVGIEPGSARPATASTGKRSSTAAFRLSRWMLLIPLAVTVDVFNILDNKGGPIRYGLLLVVVVPFLVHQLSSRGFIVRRPTNGDRLLALFWLFGVAGTTYGILVSRSAATTRPLFASMILAFVYILVPDTPTDEEAARILRILLWITAFYVLLAAVVNIGLLPSLLRYHPYRNSQFFFVAGGLAAAFVLRRWWLLALLAAFEAVNFVGYPSASSVLGLLAMVGTLYITGARASKARAFGLTMLASVMVLVAVLNFQGTLGVLSDYFSTVGKANTLATRTAVWTAGLQQFHTSPLVGAGFAGTTVATVVGVTASSTNQLPYHNDFVLFLAEGGLIGLGLVLLWMVVTERTLLRRYAGYRDSGRWAPAGLIRVFLAMFNTLIVVAAFNPTFNLVSCSATLFSLYGVVMLLGPPEGLGGARPYPSRSVGARRVGRSSALLEPRAEGPIPTG